jgi:hypothetical protein
MDWHKVVRFKGGDNEKHSQLPRDGSRCADSRRSYIQQIVGNGLAKPNAGNILLTLKSHPTSKNATPPAQVT